MERTTVFLPPDLADRARRHAERQGLSFAAIIREALTSYLAVSTAANRGLPTIAGRFGSGRADTSERVDELLWKDPHA